MTLSGFDHFLDSPTIAKLVCDTHTQTHIHIHIHTHSCGFAPDLAALGVQRRDSGRKAQCILRILPVRQHI